MDTPDSNQDQLRLSKLGLRLSKLGEPNYYGIIILPDGEPLVVTKPVDRPSAILIAQMKAMMHPAIKDTDWLVVREGKSFIHPWDRANGYELPPQKR